MADRFYLVRILFHQKIEAILGLEAAKRTLSHCDRAFVRLFDCNTWPDQGLIAKIAHKVYHHRIQKSDSFATLLEVNVQDSLQAGKCAEIKYCFLMAVVSVPGRSELICVPLHVNSFLRPGCKCLELTESSCHQRPYHIISASQTLTTYKCLLAPENGWIFVVNLSSISQSYLLTSKQYMAISSELRLYPTSMKNYRQQHSRGHLPRELLQNGDGVSVKYGAIVAAEQGPATSGQSSNRYIFIGEFDGKVSKFSRIQERVNLTNSLNKESVWPELPKHDNSTAGDRCQEQGDVGKCKVTATEGDGQAKSSKCLDGREPTIEAEDHLGTNEEPLRASNTALSELVPGEASVYGNVWNFNSQLLPMAATGEPFYCDYHQMSYFDPKDHLE